MLAPSKYPMRNYVDDEKTVNLKETYARDDLHGDWVSVYRSNPIQDRFNDKMMDRIIQYLNPPPNALFLDAGCGTAYHSIGIAKRGYRCVGIDLSEKILKKAYKNVLDWGLNEKVSLVCQGLEDLSFDSETFDVVYCRGVLMHIPKWEIALYQLCRVLKPGGRIFIMEGNHRSLEASIVLLIRRIRRSKSTLAKSEAGLEFWSQQNRRPFVVRVANANYLINQLEKNQVRVVRRIATEFWDINRFPSGIIRNNIIRFNRLWFCLHLPSFLSAGVGVMGEKISAKVS
jgi:ubiquinone/menaquinone biosynthesis C-methylase UbiE